MSSKAKRKHFSILLTTLLLLAVIVIGTISIFSDRVNQTVSISVATFSKDGYTLTRKAPNGYFVAGEAVETTIVEKNSSSSPMSSELSMSVTWSCPDESSIPWGNSDASQNAVITLDDQPLSYTFQPDGSISFTLPKSSIAEGSSLERKLVFSIPQALQGTGTLGFSFDKAIISRPNTQWSGEFTKEELNQKENLDFSVGVVWNISKDQSTKDVIAFLTDTSGNYGLEIVKNGKANNTNNGKMMDFSINKSTDTSASKDDASKWTANTPWYGYRTQIKIVSLPEALTTIGDGAFLNLSAWSGSPSIPSTVTAIGEAAFGNVRGFTSVTIPNSVKTLEAFAFTSCQGVKTISLGSGLTALPEKVFFDNLSLTGIEWGTSQIATIGKSAFERAGQKNATLLSLALPDSVKTVGESAFANTNALETLNLNKVQTIGKRAFASAQKLCELTIPANVHTLSQLAFYNCRNLTEITFAHGTSDPLSLPDASTLQGAFRLDDEDGFTPLRTSVYTSLQSVKDYDWLEDNRLLKGDPILKKYYKNSTQDFHAYKSIVTKITVMDHYAPPTTITYGPWDVSAAGDESVMAYISGTELFICSNVYSWTDVTKNVNTPVIANRDSAYLFEKFTKATEINAENLITPNTTDMCGMFSGCTSLQSLDISNFTTGLVGDFSEMFANCESLRALDVSHFDTTKMYSSAQMFYCCETLTALDVSDFKTSNLKNMNSMFAGCSGISMLDVSQWDTSRCDTMNCAFDGCSGLTTLDVSGWVTDKVTNFSGMFSDCSGLTSLDVSNFDTSLADDIAGMFSGCSSLTELDVSGFDTALVENMDGVFSDCFKIRMLDLKNWDTRNTQNMTNIFSRMRKLDTVVLGKYFVFQEDDGLLPTPSNSYITGANGHWYDTDTWFKYTPMEVAEEHSGIVTYTAYPPVLDSIEIVTPPDKVEYSVGEDFAPAGMEVQANYTHSIYPDHSRMLEDDEYTIPDGSKLTIDRTYITVSYTEDGVTKTDTQSITVKLAIPMLDDRDFWYDSDISKNSITSITLVDTYDPAGKTIVEQWDASDSTVRGTVTAYLESDGSGNGTYKLTLAGNGYGKIYANPDSYNAFSYFKKMTALNGLVAGDGTAFLDTSKVTSMQAMFNYDGSLLSLDVSKFDTSLVENFGYMFQACSSLTTVDVSNFKTDKGTTFEAMFAYCNDLITVDVSGWNTSKVQKINRMFDQCYDLKSLDVSGWDVSKVIDASTMFQSCSRLSSLDVTNWAFTSALTDTGYMFNGCQSLPAIVVDDWVMDNVTDVTAMFQTCQLVTSLDVSKWNTGSVVYMSNMFNGCWNLTELDVSNWDVSNAVWAEQMFYECKKLPTLAVDNWNVSKIKTMAAMFYHCEKLTSLNVSGWKTESLRTVTNTTGENGSSGSVEWDRGMFEACKSLAVINISGWNMSQLKNNARMFADCTSLRSLTVPASASYISPEFAYNCTSLTEITFLHPSGATVNLPDAGKKTTNKYPDDSADENGVFSDGGAFYVPSYLETKITTSNETIKAYDWATDNRAKAIPMLAKGTTWYTNGTSTAKSKISSITLMDSYDISGKTIVEQWDASDETVPNTVTAYLEDDGLGSGTYKLTLAGNGSGFIRANPKSYDAFSFSYNLTSINNLQLLNTTGVTTMNGMFENDSALTSLDLSHFKTESVTDFFSMFEGCKKLTSLDLSSFVTTSATSMGNMFKECNKLKDLDISTFNTEKVSSLYGMFHGCESLTTLDLRHFKTPKVQSLAYMFYDCESLTSLDVTSFETARLKELAYTFKGCESLTTLDVSNFTTDNVYTFEGTFMGCDSLTSLSVSHFNTSKAETMANMFMSCESLTSLDVSNFVTDGVTNFGYMFYNCKKVTALNVSSFVTDNATSMESMFGMCQALTTLDLSNFNTEQVKTMSYMFDACSNLISLDLRSFNTKNVTEMLYMFASCFDLQSVDLSSFNTEKVTTMAFMFAYDNALKSLDLSNFRTPALTSMTSMFEMEIGGSALRTLDISGFDVSNITGKKEVFYNCSDLVVTVADSTVKAWGESLTELPATVTFVAKASLSNLMFAAPQPVVDSVSPDSNTLPDPSDASVNNTVSDSITDVMVDPGETNLDETLADPLMNTEENPVDEDLDPINTNSGEGNNEEPNTGADGNETEPSDAQEGEPVGDISQDGAASDAPLDTTNDEKTNDPSELMDNDSISTAAD